MLTLVLTFAPLAIVLGGIAIGRMGSPPPLMAFPLTRQFLVLGLARAHRGLFRCDKRLELLDLPSEKIKRTWGCRLLAQLKLAAVVDDHGNCRAVFLICSDLRDFADGVVEAADDSAKDDVFTWYSRHVHT